MRSRRSVARSVAAAALCLALVPIPVIPAAAADGEPALRLLSTRKEATAMRFGNRAARLEPVFFIAATNGSLDLRVQRGSFAEPATVTQIIHGPHGRTERRLSGDLLDGWRGLDNFFRVKVTDSDGEVKWTELVTFCPNSDFRQRLNDHGPAVATFPWGCYASPRLLGMAWGIDESWAVSPTSRGGFKLPVPDGTYSVDIAITSRYRELFGVTADNASIQLLVTVETIENRCRRCKDCDHCVRGHRTRVAQEDEEPAKGVPDMLNPDDSLLPDLRALPAFNIGLRNKRSGRSVIEFAATVWVDGAAPIVVEGFRRSEEAVMDAYQYFYENGEAVGRAPAGTFVYDERDQHLHWHILQFVQYNLVDADQTNAIRSAKEAFCLVPTDPVDLAGDNASLTAERAHLGTSCGGSEALWIRETLPLGWGDTYYQGGRYGFDVTDVPNGTYFVEIEANPDGVLYEQDVTNNVELREVILKGEPGARRLIVPDPFGIDGHQRGGHM